MVITNNNLRVDFVEAADETPIYMYFNHHSHYTQATHGSTFFCFLLYLPLRTVVDGTRVNVSEKKNTSLKVIRTIVHYGVICSSTSAIENWK